MSNKLTHMGKISNHNYGKPYTRTTPLRETKLYWITGTGRKYRKDSGYPAGQDPWNQQRLDLDSIQVGSNK